jgi:predicted nucleotidyltransferase
MRSTPRALGRQQFSRARECAAMSGRTTRSGDGDLASKERRTDICSDTLSDTPASIPNEMNVLEEIARELGVSERTMRRAVAEGAIHADRPSPRRLVITNEERDWVLGHWPTIARLRESLRKERSVRLAVLFGSEARGRGHRHSDLDLLVALDVPTPARLVELEERLSAAAGQEVQLVSVGAADAAPGLMADALRDGRVLVDRDAAWPRLQQRAPEIVRAAEQRDAEMLEQALRPLEVDQ